MHSQWSGLGEGQVGHDSVICGLFACTYVSEPSSWPWIGYLAIWIRQSHLSDSEGGRPGGMKMIRD
ncbi:unnamed protein product [Protopolystoma xenopodis]|uniref:Uncharacterized protein n=1 Tax=Protopolystoma xenopodis TaxID=117903 RepID=A0A448X6N5_9PLAT|nr:unnamed protein product [Protopolystoma xenopodis]